MRLIEREHMGKVASLDCACCGCCGPSQVHHVRVSQGMAQRASNFLTVPLCPDCHTGSSGIHGNKNRMRLQKLDEMDLLAKTIEALNT